MFSWEIYGFFRRSHRSCFIKKNLLKNFAVFTGKLQACNFIKNTFQHKCFPLNRHTGKVGPRTRDRGIRDPSPGIWDSYVGPGTWEIQLKEWYPSSFQKHENNIVWERDGIKLRSQNMAAIARGT